eukprot:TRINITY_DN15653_c0_g1_i2.p1 TRINITY_DN15653_c0_g1~~TRINITY_DN15653_c0_g1_i2.p1  ORF type:complete len:649 (-),score=152.11 TRINITY_DN15653_c0_g1_i2:170-2116(-)
MAAGVCAAAVCPMVLAPVLHSLAPVAELSEAFNTLQRVGGADPSLTQTITMELLLSTAHTQVSLGYMGVFYLRKAQTRQNLLLSITPATKDAPVAGVTHRQFARRAGWFVISVAIPYFFWRTLVSALNTNCFIVYSSHLESSFLKGLFLTPHSATTDKLRILNTLNYTAQSYTDSLSSVASISHNLLSRKLLSLPKLALFPALLISQPGFVAIALPTSIVLDMAKASLVASLTSRARVHRLSASQHTSKLHRIQEHDSRHEQQLRFESSSAAVFVAERWAGAAGEAQASVAAAQLLEHVRLMIDWLYWSDGLMVGIEIMLSAFLEEGSMQLCNIWVYSRVLEDVIDSILMRSRAEADLATMQNDVSKLSALATAWEQSTQQRAVECAVGTVLELQSLSYQRGHANVHIQDVSIPKGSVVAVTGPNGAGKSTLFGVLHACAGITAPVALDPSVSLHPGVQITMPGTQVVQLTQASYGPLFARPVEWFMQRQAEPNLNSTQCKAVDALSADHCLMWETAVLVAGLANELNFQEKSRLTAEFLLDQQDNWYGTLSGGQRAKAEFIRTVFQHAQCPELLLVDEGFAALDPKAKALVQSKLREFCAQSVVLVVYHTDHDSEHDGRCVPPGFFDVSLHFENGTATLNEPCVSLS